MMSDEWRLVRVEDLAEVFDGPHATPTKTEHGPWYLSISSLKNGRIDLSESAHLSEKDFLTWTRRVQPAPGDTLFSYETRLGEAGHWSSDDQAALGRRMAILRPRRNRVDPRFLTYAYIGPQFQAEIRRRSIHGATVDRILIAEIGRWPIAVPSLDEQRRIAGVLSALDDLIYSNLRLQEILAHQRFATMAHAVSSASGSTTFGEIAELVRVQVSPEDVAPSTPYLGLEHLAENASGLLGLGVTSGLDSMKWRFEAGDVLYGKLRPYFRKVVRPNFDGVCSTEIWVLRPKENVSSEYLEWVATTQEFTDFAMAGSSGTRMPRANWDHVRTFAVSKPASEEFSRAVVVSRVIWNQYWALHDENEALRRTRDELLPALLSGQVRVEDVAA
jgi:type I restriction enzyme S subunit